MLLVASVVLIVLSIFFFTRLDQIVHGELYSYGLNFHPEWATKYWTYSKLIIISMSITILVTSISTVYLLAYVRAGNSIQRFIPSILLITATVMTGLSVFLLTRLDLIVNGDLYEYGLRYDPQWAVEYGNYFHTATIFLGVTATASLLSVALVSVKSNHPRRIDKSKIVLSGFLVAAAVVLGFSYFLDSSILSFIGLGLVFWGAILFYIRPGKYVKKEILATATLPSLMNLEEILDESGYHGKGVYLPPKYLEDLGSSKVFIGSKGFEKPPSPDQIERMFTENWIILTPPGSKLSSLFEERLGKSFAKVDLPYLEANLPKLMIEELEIAEDVEIKSAGDRVHVKLESSTYGNLWKEAEKLSYVWSSLGCQLVSAIACALAKASGKQTAIERTQVSGEQTLNVVYHMSEED